MSVRRCPSQMIPSLRKQNSIEKGYWIIKNSAFIFLFESIVVIVIHQQDFQLFNFTDEPISSCLFAR